MPAVAGPAARVRLTARAARRRTPRTPARRTAARVVLRTAARVVPRTAPLLPRTARHERKLTAAASTHHRTAVVAKNIRIRAELP
jgi:hypothetical protein